jgi:hypothetical protein
MAKLYLRVEALVLSRPITWRAMSSVAHSLFLMLSVISSRCKNTTTDLQRADTKNHCTVECIISAKHPYSCTGTPNTCWPCQLHSSISGANGKQRRCVCAGGETTAPLRLPPLRNQLLQAARPYEASATKMMCFSVTVNRVGGRGGRSFRTYLR